MTLLFRFCLSFILSLTSLFCFSQNSINLINFSTGKTIYVPESHRNYATISLNYLNAIHLKNSTFKPIIGVGLDIILYNKICTERYTNDIVGYIVSQDNCEFEFKNSRLNTNLITGISNQFKIGKSKLVSQIINFSNIYSILRTNRIATGIISNTTNGLNFNYQWFNDLIRLKLVLQIQFKINNKALLIGGSLGQILNKRKILSIETSLAF